MSRSLLELDDYLVGHLELTKDFKDSSIYENDGTPTDIEWKPTSHGMKPKFNGSSSEVDVGDAYDGVNTISLYVKLSSITEQFLDLNGTANIDINAGTVRANNITSPTIYIDGITTASLSDLTGFHQITITTETGINVSALVIGLISASYGTFVCDDLRMYSEILDADEALDLYNATKETYGVTYAERSYSHKLSPEITDDTVFATDMSTKNSDGTLVDLSGNSNHGTVTGCIRSGGYFTDGMRFNGGTTLIESDVPELIGLNDVTIESVIRFDALDSSHSLFTNGATNSSDDAGIWIRFSNSTTINVNICPTVGSRLSTNMTIGEISLNANIHIAVVFDRSGMCYLYANGVKSETPFDISSLESEDIQNLTTCEIGYLSSAFKHEGTFNTFRYDLTLSSQHDIVHRYNSLAALSIYSCDFSSMPSNTTVYTDVLPYSSAIIKSGSFKLDDGLVCVTDGQLTLRCAHEFDGAEHINFRSTPDNTRLAHGTGSVSYGDIDASISQGSSLITLDMTAGDTLDKLDIQFREILGC